MKLKYAGLTLAAAMAVPLGIWAQGGMQEKMAEVKEAVAINQAQLKTYTYQQHTQIFYKGDLKKTKNYSVVTGPDGRPQKTSLDPPPPPPQGGRLRQRIVENKVDEITTYMQQAQALIEQYVPPDPQKMQQAFTSGAASLSAAGPGMISLTFTNYVVSGDSMTMVYNQQTKSLTSISINSYLGEQKDAVILNVSFAKLPTGVNHVAMTDLVAKAKSTEVKSFNDNYTQM